MGDTNIKIPVNRKRFPVLLVVGLFFTVLIMTLLRLGGNVDPAEELTKRVIDSVILLIPLFYTCSALVEYMKTLFDKDAALFVSEKGIDDNLSVFSCGEISWSEISGVEIVQLLNMEILVVKLANPMDVINRQSILKRWILRRYVRQGRSPIMISEKKIDYNLHDLKNILTSHLK